jgi:hypothetical protein
MVWRWLGDDFHAVTVARGVPRLFVPQWRFSPTDHDLALFR